jgi:hypothetical protein
LEENITDVETGISLQCELGQEVLRNISHFIKHEELDMSDEEKFDCVGDYLPKVNRRSLYGRWYEPCSISWANILTCSQHALPGL